MRMNSLEKILDILQNKYNNNQNNIKKILRVLTIKMKVD